MRQSKPRITICHDVKPTEKTVHPQGRNRELAEVMCHQSTEDRSQSNLEDTKIIKESLSTASHTPHSNVFAGSQRKVSKVRVLWKQLKQTARE